jgi:hypothetical protein
LICTRCELVAALAIWALGAPAAMALDDARLNRQLLRLDLETRLEQTCDMEIMHRINREHKKFNVDKVIAYTFKNPISAKNVITAPGAVLRSRGDWYRLQFKCVTGPRHLNAHSMQYRIGSKIPRSRWHEYDLYD